MRRLSLVSMATVTAFSYATAVHAQQPVPPPDYGIPITQAQSMKVAAAAQAKAKEIGQRVVITIVGPSGDLIYFTKMDGAQIGSNEISLRKAKAAALYRRPTKVFEDGLAKGGGGLGILLLPNVIASGGGLPIMEGGKIIGAIGVSGSPTGTIDAEASQAGLDAMK